jgi:chorismate-pyruvate lyase
MMDGGGGFIQGDTALAALRSICDGFIDSSSWLDRCEVVSPDALPGNIRRLLAHEQHMTPTLRDHFGGELRLEVLDHRQNSDEYARKILLWNNGAGTGRDRLVEFGIVRMDLSSVSREAAEDIVSRRTPLGDILRTHGVLTRVRPHWYLRIPADCEISRYFDSQAVFGRLATIDVHGCPAVNLFEAVAD